MALDEVFEIGTLRYLDKRVRTTDPEDPVAVADTLDCIHEELDLGHITVEARDKFCELLAERRTPEEFA